MWPGSWGWPTCSRPWPGAPTAAGAAGCGWASSSWRRPGATPAPRVRSGWSSGPSGCGWSRTAASAPTVSRAWSNAWSTRARPPSWSSAWPTASPSRPWSRTRASPCPGSKARPSPCTCRPTPCGSCRNRPEALPGGPSVVDGVGDGCPVLGGPGEAELAGAGVHAQVEHALAGDLGVVEHDLDGQAVDQGAQPQGEGVGVEGGELAGGLALADDLA